MLKPLMWINFLLIFLLFLLLLISFLLSLFSLFLFILLLLPDVIIILVITGNLFKLDFLLLLVSVFSAIGSFFLLKKFAFFSFFVVEQFLDFFVLHAFELVLLLFFSCGKFEAAWSLTLLQLTCQTRNHKIRFFRTTLHI